MMIEINRHLVSRLIREQFPQWADLPITPVKTGGWDNRMFHLGDAMAVRLPSHEAYVPQIEKEQRWLPKLGPVLPLPIPTPVGLGKPSSGYPWPWSVYRWLDGDRLEQGQVVDRERLARDLAFFLASLRAANTTAAPFPGRHNFFRGGSLRVYDHEVHESARKVAPDLDTEIALKLWNEAVDTVWPSSSVWVHGDVAEGNLILSGGKLCGVIDFGCMAVGDPACDLAIAWTFFDQTSRAIFKASSGLDELTWKRGRAWALWKALITLAQSQDDNAATTTRQRTIINGILHDFGETGDRYR